MRAIIVILLILMLFISGNIVAYIVNEDYRFFLKKIKYQTDVVYQQEKPQVDDNQRMVIIDNPNMIQGGGAKIIVSQEDITFLEALSGEKKDQNEDILSQITRQEQEVLLSLQENFILKPSENSTLLFGITDEYPDLYREYINAHMSFYMFSTKRYGSVKNIFDTLSFELPIYLNETNTFLDASFFINMDENYDDGLVRIVFEYESYVFGLKIKKDNYNMVKRAFEKLKNSN